jgi:hypothetical protein
VQLERVELVAVEALDEHGGGLEHIAALAVVHEEATVEPHGLVYGM